MNSKVLSDRVIIDMINDFYAFSSLREGFMRIKTFSTRFCRFYRVHKMIDNSFAENSFGKNRFEKIGMFLNEFMANL